jgi:hypothetical protein
MADLSEFLEIIGEAAVEAELASVVVQEELAKWAEAEVVPVWQSFSPVGGDKDPNAGTYRDSIKVTREDGKVLVGSDDPKANLIEWGSIHNPEFAPRARTEAHFNGGRE